MLKGVSFSLFASLLFGLMYYLAIHLRPLSGEGVFGIRMVVTLPFLFLSLFLFKQTDAFLAFLARIKQQPSLLLVMLLTSSIVGSQMWLFLWAPNSGKAIEVSMGYLLMPIVMVAFGRFMYKEPLSRLKKWAIGFALFGVLSNILLTGKLSWESLFVCTGYPIYFYLRRKFGISHLHSFVLEIVFLIPISLYFMHQVDMAYIESENSHIYVFIALLGLISGSALISYTMASTILPFNVLGLLGYVEPCFMLIISFLIGERLAQESYLLMSSLLVAILLLTLDGLSVLRRQRKHFKRG